MEVVAGLLEKDLWGTGKFMSLLLMLWDAHKQQFCFSSAGHEHIIHYKAKEKKCEATKAGGVVLGLKKEKILPHLEEQILLFEPNDVIVLFTDGVTEAMNEANDMFSLEKVVELTQEYSQLSAQQILDNIYQQVENFIGTCEQFDDITMVAIKRKER
jgi:serine phosphatase RsbU (regulator of sigma subunit)